MCMKYSGQCVLCVLRFDIGLEQQLGVWVRWDDRGNRDVRARQHQRVRSEVHACGPCSRRG